MWVKKIPWRFLTFFPKREFLDHILDTYYTFQLPIYARLQIFVQLSAILTTFCHIERDHLVHTISSECSPSSELTHAGIIGHFVQTLGKFLVQILHTYYTFLSMLDYTFFIQLPLTVTKLWNNKCDHPACVSTDGGHFEHWWSSLIWRNFVKVAGNWMKICSIV